MVVAILAVAVVALIIGGWFMLKAVVRVNQAMLEMTSSLADLKDMGPRLQRLAGDVSQLAESIEEKRPQ